MSERYFMGTEPKGPRPPRPGDQPIQLRREVDKYRPGARACIDIIDDLVDDYESLEVSDLDSIRHFAQHISRTIRQQILSEEKDNATIEDGFGGEWSAWCPRCGCKSMSVVRPGKVQCMWCG